MSYCTWPKIGTELDQMNLSLVFMDKAHTEAKKHQTNVLRHEISNNVVCATSKASGQPAHRRSLIRAFASR